MGHELSIPVHDLDARHLKDKRVFIWELHLLTELMPVHVQSHLDISNSDILNSAKLEASI